MKRCMGAAGLSYVRDAVCVLALIVCLVIGASSGLEFAHKLLFVAGLGTLVLIMGLSWVVEERKTERERIEEGDERAVLVRMQTHAGAFNVVMAWLRAGALLLAAGFAVIGQPWLAAMAVACAASYMVGRIATAILAFRFDCL